MEPRTLCHIRPAGGQISHGKYLPCLSGSQASPALGQMWNGGGGRRGTVRKMNEEEDEQILQGVSEEMRGRDGDKEGGKEGEKAEIPSSGFSLKPPVKVNEGCVQSPETDYITAPLINGLSMHLSPCVCVCVCSCVRLRFDTCATGCA